MKQSITELLKEHNYGEMGPSNSFVLSPSKPTIGNFPGRIWEDESTGNHYIYDGTEYKAVSHETTYGGMKREKKAHNGAFLIVEKLNDKKQVIHRSTLSHLDGQGNYTQRTLETDIGTSAYKRSVFRVAYDGEGDMISETLI